MARLAEYFPSYRILLLLLTGWYIWSQQYFTNGEVLPENYHLIGAPYASAIYQGDFWGIFSNSFVHIKLWHFATSLLLLTLIGGAVEQIVGRWKFLLFFVFGSIFTSAVQLAMSGDPGVGFSGVNALFMGYLLHPRFKLATGKLYWANFILVFGSLALIIFNQFLGFIPIALSSILAGYIFGYLIGIFRRRFWTQLAVMLVALFVSIFSLYYNPYSSEWHTVQGYEEFEDEEWGLARWHYKQALRIYPKNHVAKVNLKKLTIAEYKDKAYKAHLSENYKDAIFFYEKVLQFEPENEWAKNNLKTLK